jgi:hypothetical protein
MQVVHDHQQAGNPGRRPQGLGHLVEKLEAAPGRIWCPIGQQRHRSAHRAQDLNPWPVRRRALPLQARAPGDPDTPITSPIHQRLRERGLARPSLALHQHQPTPTRRGGPKPALQIRQLAGPPDKDTLAHDITVTLPTRAALTATPAWLAIMEAGSESALP